MNTSDSQHEKIIASINSAIAKIGAYEFIVYSYIDGVLEIVGSFDVPPYYLLENDCIAIEFQEVSYISLPTYYFSYPIFRLATTSEILDVGKLVDIDSDNTVYCIEAATTASIERLPFFLVAENISFQVKN